MLEQKPRLKHSMETNQSVYRVIQFWGEYCEAYERLHKPSPHHIQDYCTLMDAYTRYVVKQKELAKNG